MKSSATALLYNLNQSEQGKKIKFILIQMGIRIKNIAPEDYLKPVGALAGIPGFEPSDTVYEGEGFLEEMMVLKDFTERQLDEMMFRFRKEKVEKVNLKAVITPTNQTWNSLKLYEEIKKEHEQMSGKKE